MLDACLTKLCCLYSIRMKIGIKSCEWGPLVYMYTQFNIDHDNIITMTLHNNFRLWGSSNSFEEWVATKTGSKSYCPVREDRLTHMDQSTWHRQPSNKGCRSAFFGIFYEKYSLISVLRYVEILRVIGMKIYGRYVYDLKHIIIIGTYLERQYLGCNNQNNEE